MKKPLKSSLEIRLNNLELDCQEQPRLMYRWGTELAEVRRKIRDAKKALKRQAALIRQNARQNPGEYGLEKVTEGALEDVVNLDSGYAADEDALSELEYEEDIIAQYLNGLRDRKTELENLTHLHGQMYWSKPVTEDKQPLAARVTQSQQAAAKVSTPNTRRKKG